MSLKNFVNLALSDSQNTRYPKALQVQSFSSKGQSKQKLKLHRIIISQQEMMDG